MKTEILIVNMTGKRVETWSLKKLCVKLFKTFGKNRVVTGARPTLNYNYLTVALVLEKQSKQLNFRFRGKNKATDVLSFAPGESRQGLGELVLCVPVLRRQAAEHGHSLRREMEMMMVHGFLHLLGYDHEKSRKEELKMMRLQDKLLKTLT